MSDKRDTVGEWMSSQPHTLGDDQSLQEAKDRMNHWGVRHLPVLHGGRVVGIVSERDIALVESLDGIDVERVPIREAMTQDPETVLPGAPLREVATLMAERRIGAVLVVDTLDKIVGVFTTTDALRALAERCA